MNVTHALYLRKESKKKFAKNHQQCNSPDESFRSHRYIQSSSIYQSTVYQSTALQFHADSLKLIKILIVLCRARANEARGSRVEEKYNYRFLISLSFVSFPSFRSK